jgi:DNA-binding beta-propeller fold protein YncE
VGLGVVFLVLLIVAASALAVTGQLVQLSGTAGCVSESGAGGACIDGKALVGANSVAVSPDGGSVYVASQLSDAVAVLARDPTSGSLSQSSGTAGCVSETGDNGACADGKALDGSFGVAVSPDGRSVYVASQVSNAITVFQRDTVTGELTQLPGTAGCVSNTGSGGTCTDGKALDGARSVAVSPDGDSVYVASSFSDAVAVFQRDTTTGELTQLEGSAGCVRQGGGACRNGKALDGARSVAVSADGKNVYVASTDSDAVAVLNRNTTTGALFQPSGTGGCVSETGTSGVCADGKALDGPLSVAASQDSKHLYVASTTSDAVALFRRNSATGALTQPSGPSGKAGCVSEAGSGGACADGKALDAPTSVVVSADGRNVYVGAANSQAVAVFARSSTSGVLTQLAGQAGCVSQGGTSGTCTGGKALFFPFSVAASLDGKSVYVVSGLQSGGQIAVFARETPP